MGLSEWDLPQAFGMDEGGQGTSSERRMGWVLDPVWRGDVGQSACCKILRSPGIRAGVGSERGGGDVMWPLWKKKMCFP